MGTGEIVNIYATFLFNLVKQMLHFNLKDNKGCSKIYVNIH